MQWHPVAYTLGQTTFQPLGTAACVCVEMGQIGENLLWRRLRPRRVVCPGRVSAIVLDARIGAVQSGFSLQPLDFGVEGRGQVCDQGLDVAHLMLNR